MSELKKIMTISIITLKSYYLSTSRGIALLVLPFIMIFVFLLQNKSREEVDSLRLIINGLLLVSCFANVNVIASSIGYDIHFLRMKLYKASNLSYRQYMTGVIVPAIASTLLSQLIIVAVSSLFFSIRITEINFVLFFLTSIITSLSLMAIGVYIGFYSKDIVAAHTISNLVTSFLTFFGGVFFPVDNFPFPILSAIAKAIPLSYSSHAYYASLAKSFQLQADIEYQGSLCTLILLSLISMGVVYMNTLWAKNKG